MSKTTFAYMLKNLMTQYGITPARLRRYCWRVQRIPARRVEQALAGNPGHLGVWNEVSIWEWQHFVCSAWLVD